VVNGGTGVTTSTGTGSVVLSNNPSLTTPNIGAATGTSLNLSSTLAAGVTTLSSTLNVTGAATFSNTVTIPTGAGAGRVLTSDANGLASWTYGGGTTSTKTGAYTILLTDKYVFYGSTASAAATLTLPAATGNDGKEIIIKNKSAFILTIQSSGSETIFQENSTGNNAATSITLGIESSNNWVKLVSDGTQWVAFRALF
jgi:hypothetical protein